MRHRLTLTALALTACVVPAPAPSGPPPGALAEQEPVSFLLERAQRLGIPESVTTQLARLNLRLFGRNRPLQVQIDTLVARPGERARADTLRMSPAVRARVDTLMALIRQNNVAAKDTAWGMLTEAQRARADSMLAAAMLPSRERQGPPGGPPR